MTVDSNHPTHCDVPLITKRMVIAQVSLCQGCCCGRTDRGKPEVPVDWLKKEWKSRGLSKSVQLTISGCLGPCDLVNVVRISGASKDIWLGNLRCQQDYLDLADWAEQSKTLEEFANLPESMRQKQFTPFSCTV